jgi:hypothetical protein
VSFAAIALCIASQRVFIVVVVVDFVIDSVRKLLDIPSYTAQTLSHPTASRRRRKVRREKLLQVEQSPSNEDGARTDSQERPSFSGTRMFVTVFTSSYHWTLS